MALILPPLCFLYHYTVVPICTYTLGLKHQLVVVEFELPRIEFHHNLNWNADYSCANMNLVYIHIAESVVVRIVGRLPKG